MTQTAPIFGMGKVCGAVLEDFALSEDVDVVPEQRPVLADDQKRDGIEADRDVDCLVRVACQLTGGDGFEALAVDVIVIR